MGVQGLVMVQVQIDTLTIEGMGQKDLRIYSGRVYTMGTEIGLGPIYQSLDGPTP
jgi:hypothetical protein